MSSAQEKKGGDVLQKLSPLQNLALGTSAGVIAKLLNYPLLAWKNASQQGKPISMNPAVVYRGLPMACLNLGGTTAAQFWFTGFFQRVVTGGSTTGITSQQMCAAALLGGLCSGVPCSLWELTMIQQQNFGGSVMATPMRLVREHGAAILGRGMIMTVCREGLYTAAMLGVTPAIQSELVARANMNANTALMAGAVIGATISATITHPMDTIKTCMQGDCAMVRYQGIRATGGALVDEYGVAKGLFKGLGWRITLISTTFFLVNQLKQVLAPAMFPSLLDDIDGQ